MGLIKEQITKDEKLQKTREDLDLNLKAAAASLYFQAQKIFNIVWNNEYGLTAQDVFDQYGPDGLDFAKLFASAQPLVAAIDPNMWKLVRPATVTPVLDSNNKPTGYVTIILNQ